MLPLEGQSPKIKSEAHLIYLVYLTFHVQWNWIIFMLCVCFECLRGSDSRAQPGANYVWLQTLMLIFPPTFSALVWIIWDIRTRAIHVDSRNLLFLLQEEFSWGCRGQVCPKPKLSLFQNQNTLLARLQSATTVIVSFLLMELSSLYPADPEGGFISQVCSWVLFSRLNQRGFVS